MAISDIKRQVRMVFDLNKCIGCQTCTSACKTMWTNRNSGQMYMYWNNVETKPGRGYPKNWETLGGGWEIINGVPTTVKTDTLPPPGINADYGAPWEYNYTEVQKTEGGSAPTTFLVPTPDPSGSEAYSMNWDEDRGLVSRDAGNDTYSGTNEKDSYYFYLPRICNHCTNPACVAACPRKAPYKRQEDGIVLIDQERCRGYRFCVKGCPYKKPFFNPEEKISQKCIFCYPRIEKDQGNFCVAQCAGRIRWVGYNDPNDPLNSTYNVNKLVDEWRVALRLHPEFGTKPNTFYIPPLSAPAMLPDGRIDPYRQQRIPVDYLADMFGDNETQTHADRVLRIQEIFGILETERAKVANGGTSELVDILISKHQADRIQV